MRKGEAVTGSKEEFKQFRDFLKENKDTLKEIKKEQNR